MTRYRMSVGVRLKEVSTAVPAMAGAVPERSRAAAPVTAGAVGARPADVSMRAVPARKVAAQKRSRAEAPVTASATIEAPSRARRRVLVGLIVGSCAVPSLFGLPYYLLPLTERVRHPLHEWLKPSGYIGQTAGIVAFLIFAFMYLYPVRRRFRQLAFLGSLPRWLDVHIVAGLTVVLVSALHSSWRFGGVIGLGFWSMLLVAASGIVGRYLYVHIPRSRSGLALSFEEIGQRRKAAADEIARSAGLDVRTVESMLLSVADPERPRGILGSLAALIASDFKRRRAVAALHRRLNTEGRLDRHALARTTRLARRQIALAQQMKMLEATHRLFRLWHVVHRPFSITAFVAVVTHVIVVIFLGVTWFR